jgi:hypothetical protein
MQMVRRPRRPDGDRGAAYLRRPGANGLAPFRDRLAFFRGRYRLYSTTALCETPVRRRAAHKTLRFPQGKKPDDLFTGLASCAEPKFVTLDRAPSQLLPGKRADIGWINTEHVDRDQEVVIAKCMAFCCG